MNVVRRTLVSFCIAVLAAAIADAAAAQVTPPASDDGAPNVFLDCEASSCDSQHIRNEIRFVNWMRDRNDADVYLIATSLGTGGGGESYRITTYGSGRFAGDSAEVRFTTGQGSTSAERRDELTSHIAAALVRYAALTDAASRIVVSSRTAPGRAAPQHDPWNNWVFSAAVSADLDGESRQREREIELSFQADRVTEQLKLAAELEGEFYRQEVELSDGRVVGNERRDIEGNALVALAIAPRWSAGARADAGTSTFANQDFFARIAGLLEYSFLPYSEFSRRQITLRYSIGARYFDYEIETIYDRLSERRADQQLALNLDFRQPWGSASVELSGAHYFHDLQRYNLTSEARLDVRLLRGFSLDIFASYERVRDQIYIPKGDATDEEVLLRRRALETGYRYSTSVGLRYTFGSIYSTIVNPRLDN